jgi:hypothetical protein
MSVLTPGAFSAHLAFLLWLESTEAKDSVPLIYSLLFSNRGNFHERNGKQKMSKYICLIVGKSRQYIDRYLQP